MKRPSMCVGMSEQQRILRAYLKQVKRLRLSIKDAAAFAMCATQSLYSWRRCETRMRITSAGDIKACTDHLQRVKHKDRDGLMRRIAELRGR